MQLAFLCKKIKSQIAIVCQCRIALLSKTHSVKIDFFYEIMHSVVNDQFSIKASGDRGINGKRHSYDLSNSSSYLVIVDLNSNMPPLILTVNTS